METKIINTIESLNEPLITRLKKIRQLYCVGSNEDQTILEAIAILNNLDAVGAAYISLEKIMNKHNV